MESIVLIITARLALPLLIFAFPLGGAVLALIADTSDFHLLQFFGFSLDADLYQKADKLLDAYYLSIEFILAMRLKDKLARKTLATYFVWRITAILLFVITGWRDYLFWGPNIFEIFYLLYFFLKKAYPEFHLKNDYRLLIVLVIIGFFKLLHEYYLHMAI